MPKLNDTHLLLLSHAAQHEGGNLYPLPDSMLDAGAPSDRAAKAIEQLTGRGLIEEREATNASQTCRTDGDIRYGQFITSIGLTAIGIEERPNAPAPVAIPTPAAPRQTKAQLVLALLQRAEGATIAELIDATGWLPHTTRAALTGLRKKGHAVEKTKRDDVTCYRVRAL